MAYATHEQYILELINRGRLDPLAEAARYGIGLNDGLAAGTIDGSAKQVLAPNAELNDAATDHSLWMLATNTFSHTGVGGSNAGARMQSAGYQFTGPVQTWGENIAWGGTTGSLNIEREAAVRYELLFESAGHRKNTLKENFREVGLGHEEGRFNQYNASMLTEKFATSGTEYFVTGVAYTDTDRDDFYSIGEGLGGITFTAAGQSDATEAAGGYAMGVQPSGTVAVTVRQGASTLATLSVDVSGGNAKVDAQRESDGNWELMLSADTDLISGAWRAKLLGVDNLDLSGHDGANRLAGNKGNNTLNGEAGNDWLYGGSGNDLLIDGDGIDRLSGGGNGDRFYLVADGLTDTIRDFSSIDRLDLREWSGVASMSDLTITRAGGDTTLVSESEVLILEDYTGSLTAGDFIFGNVAAQSVPDPIANPVRPALAEDPASGVPTIEGTSGNNVIMGTSGADHLLGHAGKDRLDGGAGADSLYGGLGNDRYVIEAGDVIGGEVGYSAGGGIDTVEAWVDYVLPSNVEILRLMGTDDLNGGGGFSPETLVGNVGANSLHGSGGNDRIVSKAGNDVLIGGAGRDTLEGNEGADVFIMTSVADSQAGATTRDFIHGFDHGADKIDLTHIDANTLRGGHQSFDFIGTVAFSGTGLSSAGELRYFTWGGGNFNLVEADVDGDGSADMQIFVNLTNAMSESDFIL